MMRTAHPLLDRFLAAMVVEQADLGEARGDQHVGRLAGQPAARDAHLHDVDAAGDDIEQRGPFAASAESARPSH